MTCATHELKGMTDLRLAIRRLIKSPGLTLVAVFSLAVGIGLNSVAFSFIDQTGLQDLPVQEPDRIYHIGSDQHETRFAYRDRIDFRDLCPAFADVVAMSEEYPVTDYLDLPRPLHANVVSRNYFTFLGLQPAAVRLFSESDSAELQVQPLVVLSYAVWQRDFGGDPDLIGKPIPLNGQTVTVQGVAPKGFVGIRRWAPEDIWYPAEVWHTRQPRLLTSRTLDTFQLYARLKPGMTVEVARTQAAAVAERVAEYRPASIRNLHTRLSPVVPAKDGTLYLTVLGAMLLPGLVLLIACANVSGLLIARAQARTQEIAVRLALGSGRFRLMRQMLTESLLLAGVAGLGGFLLALWTLRALPALLPPFPVRPFPDFYLDIRMIVFSIALSLFTTVLFGLLPAWHATRPDLMPLLKTSSGPDRVGRRYSRLHVLVVGQLTVSLVLLSIFGLFVRTLWWGVNKQEGFRLPDRLVVELKPSQYGLDKSQAPLYLREVRERLAALPSIKRTSLAATLPLGYHSSWHRKIFISQTDSTRTNKGQAVAFNAIDRNVLPAMNLRVVRGREFTAADEVQSNDSVVLISQAGASAYWPDEDPLGKSVRLGEAEGEACQIVGVVEDGPYNRLDGIPKPYFFLPLKGTQVYGLCVMLETAVPPRQMIGAVREELRRINPRVSPVALGTLHDQLRASHFLFGRQLMARFFGVIGFLGLGLAAIGLYAVVAHSVGRRTREIGIRVAVGADRRAILWMVLWQGLKLALVGLAIGLPPACAAVVLMRSNWFGLRPIDPVTFTLVSVTLLIVALLASLVPACRALKVDPTVALRCE